MTANEPCVSVRRSGHGGVPVWCVRSFDRASTGVATSGVVLSVMSTWGTTAPYVVIFVGDTTVVRELRDVGQSVLLWWWRIDRTMLWRCTKRPDDVDSEAIRRRAMPRAVATSWCVWWEAGLTSRIDLGTSGLSVGSH